MVAELSIIIVSCNQFTRTTGPCLQSLFAVQNLSLEIIVVDNGSDRHSVEQLKMAADRDVRIKLFLHLVNSGYARYNLFAVNRKMFRAQPWHERGKSCSLEKVSRSFISAKAENI